MIKMTLIKFPIGDWSGDGHGKCDWFTVKSNKPVDEVREVHFKCQLPIGTLCHEYTENKPAKHLIDQAINLGVSREIVDPEYWGTEELVALWINLLMITDPDLTLEIVDNDVPTINFYGYDDQKRHLETPGYGLFV